MLPLITVSWVQTSKDLTYFTFWSFPSSGVMSDLVYATSLRYFVLTNFISCVLPNSGQREAKIDKNCVRRIYHSDDNLYVSPARIIRPDRRGKSVQAFSPVCHKMDSFFSSFFQGFHVIWVAYYSEVKKLYGSFTPTRNRWNECTRIPWTLVRVPTSRGQPHI